MAAWTRLASNGQRGPFWVPAVKKVTAAAHTTMLLCFRLTLALAAAQPDRNAPCTGAGPPIWSTTTAAIACIWHRVIKIRV